MKSVEFEDQTNYLIVLGQQTLSQYPFPSIMVVNFLREYIFKSFNNKSLSESISYWLKLCMVLQVRSAYLVDTIKG